jgi:hypothetical protein
LEHSLALLEKALGLELSNSNVYPPSQNQNWSHIE